MFASLDSGILLKSPENAEIYPERTVCITGHREKIIIPYRNDENYSHLTRAVVRMILYRYIDMAVEKGYTDFFSGLADGTDLWAAEYIILKRNAGSSIRLIGAMPYLKHALYYSQYTKNLLCRVEKEADMVLLLNDKPEIMYSHRKKDGKSNELYKLRNYYMVDNSSAVLGFFDSQTRFTGTSQTVSYAERNGKKVRCFGLDKVYSIIDEAGGDFQKIGEIIKLLENVF